MRSERFGEQWFISVISTYEDCQKAGTSVDDVGLSNRGRRKSCTWENKRSEHFSSFINPRNQFWPLISAVLGEDLAALPYAQRLPRLLAHGVGLWDVLGECEREGSLDSAIRKPAANDFQRLRTLCPLLESVGFNGQASGKFAPQFDAAGYRTVVLPSSSPAHMALSFAQKLELWRALAA